MYVSICQDFYHRVYRVHGGFLMKMYRTNGPIPALGSGVYMACLDHLASSKASLESSLSIADTSI